MGKKILILTNIILGSILLVEAVVILLVIFGKEQESSSTDKSRSTNVEQKTTTLTAFSIYPNLNWRIIDEDDPNSLLQTSLPFLYASYNSIDISYSGSEWVANENNILTNNELSVYDFVESAHNFLEIEGWSSSIEIDTNKINVTSGDRPGASIWGYVKIAEQNLQIIILNYKTDYYGLSTNENLFNCPCNTEFRIFISDPIPVSVLLETAKGN